MNGAQALIGTLVDSGVDVCFANPGTSEMHFVAALDAVPAMRGVLALFEGVATGAADGYARMADKPAAVLLHLGPGLGNGLANLHNARRAHVPMVVVVGDHATYHKRYDAPLESDIDALAGTVSGWVRRSARTADVAADAVDAITASRGRIGVHTDPARRRVVVRRRAIGARVCPRRSRPLSTPRRCARRPSRCAPVSRRSSSSAATPPGCRVCPPRYGPPTPRVHGCCARRSPPDSNAGREYPRWNGWPISRRPRRSNSPVPVI